MENTEKYHFHYNCRRFHGNEVHQNEYLRMNFVIMSYCLYEESASQTKQGIVLFSENLRPKMPLINPGPFDWCLTII